MQKLAKAIWGAEKTNDIETRAVLQIVHEHIGDRGDDVNHHGITVKQTVVAAVAVKVIERVAEEGGRPETGPFVLTRKAQLQAPEQPMVSETPIRAIDVVPAFRLRPPLVDTASFEEVLPRA